MKKIIIAILALTITFGLLGIGTLGVFAKPEDINIIDPGKLSLSVIGKTIANEAYSFGNIKPGDSRGWDGSPNTDGMFWKVKNTGTLEGSLKISIEDINDNGSGLSTQIIPQLWINGSLISQSSNLADLPAYQRVLASGEEIKVDIAWKFKETAGNEYQGASTKLNVKFYISAPSPDTPTVTPITPTITSITPTITSITPTITPSLDVAGITEPSIKVEGINETSINVLGFTGLNPIIPIAGLAILLVGFIFLIIEAVGKRKIRINSS
jgi:hypothetical protein